jgi:transcriptional regulator with XRE-family HTH domain
MLKKKNVLKFILGLKIRQLRARRKLSLKDLADRTELSASYLNEIENGKKYPKIEKLAAIAQGLEVNLEDLVSFKTGRNLHPLLNFLEGDMVEKVPLELLGLNESDVADLMSKDPEKFASFVLTVLQLSRAFDMKLEDFYAASLRSFIELNDNYFPELEKLAKKMRIEWELESITSAEELEKVIIKSFNYKINKNELGINSALEELNSFLSEKTQTLYLNPKLDNDQRKFYLAKSMAQLLLERKGEKTSGFLAMLDDFKITYFANALLIDERTIARDLKVIFNQSTFVPESIIALIDKYQVSPELFFHRLTQILPSHFKIHEIFFLGMSSSEDVGKYIMNRELHLSQLHRPHGVRMNESYCRRWVAVRSIEKFKQNFKEQVLAQISRIEEGTEYFSISLAKKASVKLNTLQSFTIGFLINDDLKKTIKFLETDKLDKFQIGQTCERCSIQHCLERVSPPFLYEINLNRQIRDEILSLM